MTGSGSKVPRFSLAKFESIVAKAMPLRRRELKGNNYCLSDIVQIILLVSSNLMEQRRVLIILWYMDPIILGANKTITLVGSQVLIQISFSDENLTWNRLLRKSWPKRVIRPLNLITNISLLFHPQTVPHQTKKRSE